MPFFNIKLSAQQGKVDVTFNAIDDGLNGDGFDGIVRTLSIQTDQNLIVGGEYLNLNGISSPYFTRLNQEGIIDENFHTGTGFNSKVYTSHIQRDGKIVVGGSFTAYNGNSAGRLIRLNSDGSYDPTFSTIVGATTGIIYDVCEQADGKFIIVGSFTKYNGVTVNRIARILPNGQLDTSFNTGSGSSLNITNVEVLSNGKIILTGNFTKFNEVETNKIVRLYSDGTVDTSFNIGTGFNEDVNAMTVQADGKILLGGKFTSYNEIAANRIIRINEDGTVDSSFITGSGFSKDAVQVIKTDRLGNIMAGGSFTGTYNGSDVNRVCFLNSDGTIKPDLDFGSGPGSASVLALENDDEGSWYIGGSFLVFDGLNQGRLAKINSDGEYDTAYLSSGIGFDNSVYKVLPLENKKMMVFGNFKKFDNEPATRIARLLEDGTNDSDFNLRQAGANNLIKTAVLQSDGKIILAGNFTKYNETLCNRIIRILPDGLVDNTFNIGSGFNSQVYAMAIQSDGKTIVAGNFTNYNSPTNSQMRIVRLLADGSRDASFNISNGANGIIETLLIQPDGKILIGGRFTTFDGISKPKLVRLNSDGSIDSSFDIGTGFDKYFIYAIALQSDGKIIVGGNFLVYNGIAQKRILRLNANGSLDTTFNSGIGFNKGDVRSILVQPDDRVLVGGTFSGTYKNFTSLRLIRLLKNGDYDDSFDARLNNKLYSMAFTSDFRLLIGGDFNSVSGVSKHRMARLKLCLDSTIWNGVAWSNGFPSGGKQVYFKDNYSALTSSNICSCSIDEGKTITLLSGNTFGIEFDYSGSGILVLEDTASLYQQDDDIINTGIIHLKRKSAPILNFDYTYWSSPVENQKLIDVSPYTSLDKFFSYSTTSDSWKQENPSDKMISGKGYIIRGPQYFSASEPTRYEAIFKGIPANGKINLNFGKRNGFNLIGNPYPSALDADAFLIKNNSNITGVLYFWTHNTPFANNKYVSDDYAVYNLLGGVGTQGALSSGNNNPPEGFIASGQAFFVANKDSETVDFDNSMRVSGQNTTFFKPAKTNKVSVEKYRIWLNLKNIEGVFKQILLGYCTGATNSFDKNYDAESLDGNQYVDFYSISENKNLGIQGRSLPFNINDSISLGYRSTIAGHFTISIDKVDGNLSNQSIYLEDKSANLIYDLKAGDYAFTTATGVFKDRFVLRYVDKSLGTKDFENARNDVLVSVKNKTIKVNSSKENIREVMIYDVSGKAIYTKKKIENTESEINLSFIGNQLLLVKTILENGNATTNKIVF